MREDRDARDDLISDVAGQVFQRGLLGGDRRIVRTDDVDARIRTRAGVEQRRARGVGGDQPETRAQRAALARDGVVGANAQPDDLVVELDDQRAM